MLQHFLQQYPNGIAQFESNKSGPTITLVAYTHGNEIAGIAAFDYLLNQYQIQDKLCCGRLQLIIGNIAAALENKRCLEKDFNRVWDFSAEDSNTVEYQRAEEIKPYLLQSDIVLDIHSTSRPSIPMGLVAHPQTVPNALLDALVTPYLVYDILPFLHGKPLVSFVQEYRPEAICLAIETGQHTEENSRQSAISNSLTLLSHAGIIAPIDMPKNQKKKIKVHTAIYAKTLETHFLYSKNPQSFDVIPAKTAFVFDGEKELHTEEESVILMPSAPTYIGEEIGYLAEETA